MHGSVYVFSHDRQPFCWFSSANSTMFIVFSSHFASFLIALVKVRALKGLLDLNSQPNIISQ
jgi:hypothetical protein